MSRQELGLCAAAGASLLLAACETTVLGSSGILTVASLSPTGEIREAQVGDVMFMQDYVPAQLVEVQSGFGEERFDYWSKGNINLQVDERDLFYLTRPNEFLAYPEGWVVYCQVMDEPRTRNSNAPDRTCFVDVEGDQVFDQAWHMIERDYDALVDGGDVYQAIPQLDPPIPYRRVSPDETIVVSQGIRLLGSWERGRFFLGPIASGVGDEMIYYDPQVRFDLDDDFPMVLNTDGIQVEILSLDRASQTVRYRVLSQPSLGTRMAVTRQPI